MGFMLRFATIFSQRLTLQSHYFLNALSYYFIPKSFLLKVIFHTSNSASLFRSSSLHSFITLLLSIVLSTHVLDILKSNLNTCLKGFTRELYCIQEGKVLGLLVTKM
jgi:hypothetical protein